MAHVLANPMSLEGVAIAVPLEPMVSVLRAVSLATAMVWVLWIISVTLRLVGASAVRIPTAEPVVNASLGSGIFRTVSGASATVTLRPATLKLARVLVAAIIRLGIIATDVSRPTTGIPGLEWILRVERVLVQVS